MCELILGKAEKEVGLIFASVGRPRKNPAVTALVEVVAGIVAGGDFCGTYLPGSQQELIELEVIVAERTGDRSPAGQILADKGLDDISLETILLVDQVIRDVQPVGDAAGVVNIVDRATAALHGLRHAFVAGKTALIP